MYGPYHRVSRLSLVAMAVVLFSSSLSTAQEAPSEAELPPEQVRSKLLQEGSVALRMGDNATAIARFEALLELADLNIAHLNLSRALLSSGKCRAASAALARVFTAQPAEQVPLDQILKDAAALRQEMAARCPASVEVRCQPLEMELFIDDLGPLPCDGKPLVLMPGEHTLRGQLGEFRVEERFKLVLMERREVELVMERAEPEPEPEPEPDDAVDVKRAEEARKGVRPQPTLDAREGFNPMRSRVRRWTFGARIGSGGGETKISRETSETFDVSDVQDISGLSTEFFAGYRFSRRYHLHFGPKLNVVPDFKFEGDSAGFEPAGALVDLNLFGMLTYPFGKSFALFGALEMGISALSQGEGQNLDGGNFGGFGGLSYAWSDSVKLSFSIRSQAYALSNQADILADETLIEVQGSRVSLALGLEFRP